MNEKYEDTLWGKVNFLHQKSRRQCTSFNHIMDMLNKLQEACSDFSKKTTFSKSHEIIESREASMHEASEKFVQLYQLFTNEFKNAQNNIKRQMIDPILKPTNDMFNRENELFNTYSEIRNLYIESRNKMEKYNKNYLTKMKICENMIYDNKKMESMLCVNEKEKKKSAKNVTQSIKDAKVDEEKYITSVDKVNINRDREITNQKSLLQFYQKLDINFNEKVKMIIGLYLALVNKICNALLSSAQFLGKAYHKISVEQDIKDFINSNKNEKMLQKVVKFTPYEPYSNTASKKEDPSKLNIYFDVLKILKKNFKDIKPELDVEGEEKRKKLRFLCERIIKIGSNIGFTKDEKNELLKLIDNPVLKKDFISLLIHQKSKEKLKRSETLVRDLGEILIKILEQAEKEKDFENAKDFIAISQTFYYEKNDEKKNNEIERKFLFEFIKNNKWLKSIEFWDELLSKIIEKEIKLSKDSDKKAAQETAKIKGNRSANICFTQLLNFGQNMVDFGLEQKQIESIIEKYAQKYGVSKDFVNFIYSDIDLHQQEKNLSLIQDSNSKKDQKIVKEKDLTKDNLEVKNENKEKDDDKSNNIDREKNEKEIIIKSNSNEDDTKLKNKDIKEDLNKSNKKDLNEENKEKKIQEIKMDEEKKEEKLDREKKEEKLDEEKTEEKIDEEKKEEKLDEEKKVEKLDEGKKEEKLDEDKKEEKLDEEKKEEKIDEEKKEEKLDEEKKVEKIDEEKREEKMDEGKNEEKLDDNENDKKEEDNSKDFSEK